MRLSNDFRLASRNLVAARGIALAIVTALAAGIGTNDDQGEANPARSTAQPVENVETLVAENCFYIATWDCLTAVCLTDLEDLYGPGERPRGDGIGTVL